MENWKTRLAFIQNFSTFCESSRWKLKWSHIWMFYLPAAKCPHAWTGQTGGWISVYGHRCNCRRFREVQALKMIKMALGRRLEESRGGTDIWREDGMPEVTMGHLTCAHTVTQYETRREQHSGIWERLIKMPYNVQRSRLPFFIGRGQDETVWKESLSVIFLATQPADCS